MCASILSLVQHRAHEKAAIRIYDGHELYFSLPLLFHTLTAANSSLMESSGRGYATLL
jgi:hypothetical protein